MSSKGTFFQYSFTCILWNQNANLTLTTAAKKMFGKAHLLSPSPMFFGAETSKPTCIILQPVAYDTCTTIFGVPCLPRVYNYTLGQVYNELPKWLRKIASTHCLYHNYKEANEGLRHNNNASHSPHSRVAKQPL
jgi:hypothetical protein